MCIYIYVYISWRREGQLKTVLKNQGGPPGSPCRRRWCDPTSGSASRPRTGCRSPGPLGPTKPEPSSIYSIVKGIWAQDYNILELGSWLINTVQYVLSEFSTVRWRVQHRYVLTLLYSANIVVTTVHLRHQSPTFTLTHRLFWADWRTINIVQLAKIISVNSEY